MSITPSIQLRKVLGHEYAGHCHNMQVMMHDTDLEIASFLGGKFVIKKSMGGRFVITKSLGGRFVICRKNIVEPFIANSCV